MEGEHRRAPSPRNVPRHTADVASELLVWGWAWGPRRTENALWAAPTPYSLRTNAHPYLPKVLLSGKEMNWK